MVRAAQVALRDSRLGPTLTRGRRESALRDLPPSTRKSAIDWSTRVRDLRASLGLGYFEVIQDAAAHLLSRDKTIELALLPLALQARTVVELGCAMSYYDAGRPYSLAVRDITEGMMSTRVLGIACALLRSVGVPATLHSVDIREWPERPRSLMRDLGLGDAWQFHAGQDSINWVRNYPGEIDVLLVDSNHTYTHVAAELEAASAKMAPRSAIVIDNCYATFYRTGSSYMSDDDREGIERGGEFGAILDFLAAHPEWHPYWKSEEVMVMTKGWELPNVPTPLR